MAENEDGQEKSEEATPERREEFREKGQIAISKEISSVFILGAVTGLFGFYTLVLMQRLKHLLIAHLQHLDTQPVTETTIFKFFGAMGREFIVMIAPIFLAAGAAAVVITFTQTRMSWSWKRLEPKFSNMNPLNGLKKMVSMEAVVELLKSLGKMAVVGGVAFLILRGEWTKVAGLMRVSYLQAWIYWADITWLLFWSVVIMSVFIAAGDYLYNFLSMEKKLMMTKQEVKEEFKKRESDPHLKAKMKRMAREIAMSKTVQATRKATVVVTNPTHFAVAISYELGMNAPVVVAKGQDYVAQRMKEAAKESDVPIIENKPLARTLYKICEVGHEIPESLYKAVSEVIRYVFLLKGKKLTRNPK
ncbi:MAG: EscU/YscU/HrcU family type III secretion system export apparatus switch protein [Oligoflexus sp.]|jgi:flagellar biosynthetic protein FlhB